MTAPVKINFKMYQGSTFKEVFRWESNNKIYKSISNITKSAPIVIESTAHGIPVGWRAKIVGVGGMKEINSDSEYRIITSTTANDVTINSINSLAYTTYTTGGVLEYNQPVDLTGCTARMQIRQKVSSDTVLLELTTENGGITLDNALSTITIRASETQTKELTFSSAVYSLEIVKAGEVTPLIAGNVILEKEITR